MHMCKTAKLAGLTLYSLVVACLVLEVGVRVWQGIPLLSANNFLLQHLEEIRQHSGLTVHDQHLGWRMPENSKAEGGTLTTGPYGLRMNSNEIRPSTEGGILAVGDSFTVGFGVSNSETWPAQLETMLNQPVHNAGTVGWGVDQMILRAEQLVPRLHPKVLIMSVLARDSLRNSYEMYAGAFKPFFVIQNGRAVLKGVPVPEVSARPWEPGALRMILGHSYFFHWAMMRIGKPELWIDDSSRYKQVQSVEVAVEISCLLMDRLAQLRDNHALRVTVLMQYQAGEISRKGPPWYGPPVLDCAKQHGFETLDTYPLLKSIAGQDPERFIGLWLKEGGQLGHMSAAGNRVVARLVRDRLI